MVDLIKKFSSMIHSMACDFNLAADPESGHGLDELQIEIEQGDLKMLKDIKLLQELSCGIGQGKIQIMKLEGRGGDEN